MKLKNFRTILSVITSVIFLACSKNDGSPGNESADLSIKSINPTSGPSGTIDTLIGTGFSDVIAEDSVFVNGKKAIVMSASDTKLIIKIPTGAGTGNVTVSVKGKSATGPVFTVTGDSLYVVSTFAGSGTYAEVDGTGIGASFLLLTDLAIDPIGNLYVTEYENRVRKITPDGVVTLFAGNGTIGSANGTGTNASFYEPESIATDASGNLYVSEWKNNDIRKISPAGVVTTYAGALTGGYTDGSLTEARFSHPGALTVDANGNIYIFDTYNNRIRKITSAGVVSTFLGTGVPGSTDGTGTAASIGNIQGCATDASGNLYMTDFLYSMIRKATPQGVTSTLAGSRENYGSVDGIGAAAVFNFPKDIAVDKYGNCYVSDQSNNTIRKITPAGVVSTIAGIVGTSGSDDGPADKATFNEPGGIAVDTSGNIYVADVGNSKIRKLTPQ